MAQANPNPILSAPKPPAKRLIPILLGAAGMVLLGGGGVLVGLNSKLTTLQTSAQQKDAEVSSSEQIAHRYQTTLDNYNQTQAHIQYLESSVPDRAYVPTLLAQIQALATQTHLSVAAIRPTASAPAAAPTPAPSSGDGGGVPSASSKKVAPPPYDTLDVAVDVAGSYADTSMFLYSLTRFPKIVSVDSVQMHPGAAPKGGGPALITTNLKLTAFMFHDGDASTAAVPTAAVPTAAVPTAAVPTPALPTASAPPAASAAIPALAAPTVAPATVGGSAGRAAVGAVSVTKAANTRSTSQLSTL